MTITASEKIEDREQADGSRAVAFKFTFHAGLEIYKRFLAAHDHDASAGIASMVPIVEQQVIDDEDEQLLADVETGGLAGQPGRYSRQHVYPVSRLALDPVRTVPAVVGRSV